MPRRIPKTATRSGASKAALRWVRVPHQARSQQKLESIIAAAEKLIAQKGFAATSIPEIAREAGCSVGLIYTRFKDKDDLLRYVIEHFLEETIATGREVLKPAQWEGVPFGMIVGTLIRGWVKLHERREGLFFAFYENVQRDPVLSRRLADVAKEMEALCYALAVERAEEIGHPDLRVATAFALRIPTGILLQHTFLKRVTPKPFPVDILTRELVISVLAYFGVEQPDGVVVRK
jgi:AcrR family transcriptional regulator